MPGGLRQVDCDGPADAWLDASGSRLWNASDPSQQELIATRFVENQSDLLRDALLEAHDAPVSLARASDRGRGALLGRIVWQGWIRFRDRTLREMRERGETAQG